MELEESTCLTSGSTTKPQSSRQYGTGTKTEIQINGTKQKAQRQIHTPMDTPMDTLGFPVGSEVKASASNAGDPGLIPGSRRSPGEGNDNPLQYSCLENPMD